MTRTEFDAYFAATQHTTEGFTDAQLDQINDAVFAEVCNLDVWPWRDGRPFDSEQVQTVMERIMNSWPHDGSKRPEAASLTRIPPILRCDRCDNGIEIKWEFCAWCGQNLIFAAGQRPEAES